MEDEIAERFEATSLNRGKGGGKARGGGRGGRGGGRGGGGGGSGGRDVNLSRALSKLLRHQAASAGIPLDSEGFAPLDRVLQWGPIKSLQPTFSEIVAAVRDSDKQRFALKPNAKTNPALDESSTDPAHWLIRANQGHSIKQVSTSSLLKPIVLSPSASSDGTIPEEGSVPIPPTVVHGTYFAFWPAILASGGLRPMGRNHVHCSTGLPEDSEAGVVSGMRQDAELLVENGVVLTEGDEASGLVPTRFFKEVVGRKQDVGVLWRDGEKVADLPAGIKIRTPMGKGRVGGGGGGGRGRGRGGGSGSRGGGGRGRGGKKGEEEQEEAALS
ncbi:KptA family-domain-containing protein [Bombardia bombarda]|uniref:2'-phosphotransferase n=1 Tax=Bombardia bombarda TaxID=252184 RepID=A0AA39XB92_9PEZI|nr:KptA family-domain-containing protein [Bombardia bombarda]